MSDAPAFFGISMASQRNRRMLVAVMYAVPLTCVVVILMAHAWVHSLGPLGRQVFVFAGLGLFLAPLHWFTRLAKFTPLGGRPVSVEVTRLGLTPGPRDPYDPDEREVAIRHAAHYKAYRFIALCSMLLIFVPTFVDRLGSVTLHRLMMVLAMLVVFVVWTLPQAIILWTEPDMPEEVKV